MPRLTAAFVRTIRPTDRPKRYGDGNGLYLLVKPGTRGGKSWVQRLTIQGVRRDLGLGSAELVSLKEARLTAFDNRRLARAGFDPRSLGRRTSPPFADAAEVVIDMHRPAWRPGGGSEHQWRASLRAYVYPRIGHKPVHAVNAADVMAVLLPIWTRKHATARRVRHRISAVMKWAVVQGYRQDNPAGDAIGAALPKQGVRTRHFTALPYGKVAEAIAAVRGSGAPALTILAFEFLVLTACRSAEVRGARWEEMDLETREWRIPAVRMKTNREHRVPLSTRAMAVLGEARGLDDGSGWVFPSTTSQPHSRAALSKMVRQLGIQAVPHGFRSSFRDWAAERTEAPHAVMEAALAHTIHNPVEAAYARSDLFERRRRLMQQWADYLVSTP